MRLGNAGIAYLPIVILPAVTPAILLPLMLASHIPDYAKGLAMGVPIGLSLVGFPWMVRGHRPGS